MMVSASNGRYILNGHVPVEEPNFMKWAAWFETANRHVARTELGDVSVSTVFLGLDHGMFGGRPLLFETMIFGGEQDQWMERCSTWEEAERVHARALKLVKGDGV